MDTGDRGTGRTTKQIKEAPQGAIFICPPDAFDYTRRLVHDLGRTDLRIERPSFFDGRWHGLRLPIVVDHAAPEYMTNRERDGWGACAGYLRVHNISVS